MNKALFDKYAKTYGTRFSKAQKKKFMGALIDDMKEIGYEPTLMKGKKLIFKAENYFFGSLKNMKTVIVVPYDTPEKKFWNKVIYFPFDGSKTVNKTVVATYAPVIILYLLIFIGLWIGNSFVTSLAVSTMLSLGMFLLVLFLIYLMMHGVSNRKNYNRNSIAIVEAIELAKRLNKDEKKQIAFLFTDMNRTRFLGAQTVEKDFNNAGKNPNMIILDCIGKGKETKIAFNPQNRKLAGEIAKRFPDKKTPLDIVKLEENMRVQNAMSFYKKAVVIASGDIDKDGSLYILGSGTSKDVIVDEEKADHIQEMLYRYLHN